MKGRGGIWLVIIGAVVILVSINRALTAGTYPPGDLRNQPVFWLVVSGAFIVLGAVAVVRGLWEMMGR